MGEGGQHPAMPDGSVRRGTDSGQAHVEAFIQPVPEQARVAEATCRPHQVHKQVHLGLEGDASLLAEGQEADGGIEQGLSIGIGKPRRSPTFPR